MDQETLFPDFECDGYKEPVLISACFLGVPCRWHWRRAKYGKKLMGAFLRHLIENCTCEKLRAICQQMPDYAEIVPDPSRSARARDFFDIVVIMEKCGVALSSPSIHDLLREVFRAKRVPLSLIPKIALQREFHRSDFDAVKNTLKPGEEIHEFDYYFDYVIERCRALETLWKE